MGDLVLNAVIEGSFKGTKIALMQAGDLDTRDSDGRTALTLAAADGRVDLVKLLLDCNAGINYPNQWGMTALSLAVFGGHMKTTQLLLENGADIHLSDEDGDTPLHVAVISKNLDLVRLLLERNANVVERNKSGLTPLEMARQYRQTEIEAALEESRGREMIWKMAQPVGGLQSFPGGVSSSVEPEEEAELYSEKKCDKEESVGYDSAQSSHTTLSTSTCSSTSSEQMSARTLLPLLLELCAGMAETLDICEDLLERLLRVQQLVDEKGNTLEMRVKVSFQQITTRFHAFLMQHSSQPSVERLASTRTMLDLLRGFHYDINEVVTQISPAKPILFDWKERWDTAVAAVEDRLVQSWKENSPKLSRELPNTLSQTAALLLLNSETTRHKPRYSVRSQDLLESASIKIARMSGAPIPEIPEWFVPHHEVQRQARSFASGSYGEVYRGIWRGSKVVIKCVSVTTSLEKKAFLREARIWHRSRHPHIVNFFGACYDTHPCFFICEEALKGNLVDYLDRMKEVNPVLIWSKLHEAALGLAYLHQNDIVHGDLKCNQILITGEGVAKLTDFGFSFVLSGSKPMGSGGATRWRAPECLGCNGQMPTIESDVYSFGMCVVEAMTHSVPWGKYLPDEVVIDHLRHRRFLPQPQQFVNDIEWEFIRALCEFEPAKRIKLSDAIKQLERFAEGGRLAHNRPSMVPIFQEEQQLLRLSKKASLMLLEETRKSQAQSQVFYAVLCLTARRRYLRFYRAVQTLQLLFRYKLRLYQDRVHALAATKISSFIRMIYQQKKFVRFVCAVQTLQCRFRYRSMLRVTAPDSGLETDNGNESPDSSLSESHTDVATNSLAAPLKGSSQTVNLTGESASQATRSPWINDEDRIKCCICIKDFTMFRRKHHCRVCFEIICGKCSLTRRSMRVCMVCAGLRPPVNDPEVTATIRPQARGRGRIRESTGGIFSGFSMRFSSRRGATQPAAYSSNDIQEMGFTTDSYNSREQTGLWDGDIITAARIPRNFVTISSTISRGAFGMVHLGTYHNTQVAIKTLLPESRKDMSEINQFLDEARLLATMEHPCIVNFVGIAWDSLNDICIVMEYMERGDLRSLLDQYDTNQYPVGFDNQKLAIALNVASALTYLHSLVPPVLHRDLKPRNILLNNAMEAKVTDFGVSREIADSTMTAGVGTALWMAPEVVMGERYNEKSDIFSLGIVLSELDTHKAPYSQERQSGMADVKVMQHVLQGSLRVKFSPETPQSIVELGNSCISLEPWKRPSAAEAMYKLHSALRDLS